MFQMVSQGAGHDGSIQNSDLCDELALRFKIEKTQAEDVISWFIKPGADEARGVDEAGGTDQQGGGSVARAAQQPNFTGEACNKEEEEQQRA